ncbi:ABC transporter permease [Ruegeria sp. 2205SS24-7]|nr:ABC transporter permease [Ruegeria sp. 2205SS24-7]
MSVSTAVGAGHTGWSGVVHCWYFLSSGCGVAWYGDWLVGGLSGLWDTLIMRFADIQLALPFILMAITVIAIVGPRVDRIIILMIVSQWVQYARLVRSSVLSLRAREFVQVARSYGLGDRKIIFGHILANALGPLIILLMLNVANNILLESSLTFLGLGANPQTTT